jgi:hypothetical protein
MRCAFGLIAIQALGLCQGLFSWGMGLHKTGAAIVLADKVSHRKAFKTLAAPAQQAPVFTGCACSYHAQPLRF